jgi:hypothetical protein
VPLFSLIRCCPQCQSKEVHRSHRKGVVEHCLLPILLLRPFRCDMCDRRYNGLVLARRVKTERPPQDFHGHPAEL